ncbi:hypothetical protein CAEBREN_09697 [Caenorhabditis brenneri]|uniref:DUF38 domain-containing protein n=1 Tax=Caenorhabditis brenneri TaxID=135651 RepID=G0M6R3_CAEBE|nr:hypothetical protein CAEBREN_09697 [Caenorhabditis brenneri]
MSNYPSEEIEKKWCFRSTFNAKLSPEVALIFVQHFFPSATIEDVEIHFELFKNEMKNEARRALHKSSLLLSTYISKSFKIYEAIRLCFSLDTSVTIDTKEVKPRLFYNDDNVPERKLSAEYSRERTERLRQSYPTMIGALAHFEELVNQSNVQINRLYVYHHYKYAHRKKIKEFYAGVQQVLNERETELHVEDVTIHVENSEISLSILKQFKSNLLERVLLYTLRKTTSLEILQMEEIVKTEQWKNLAQFYLDGFTVDLSLSQLSHFSYANVEVPKVTIEEILSLRNELIQNPRKFNQRIKTDMPDGLLEALMPFMPSDSLIYLWKGMYLCKNDKKLQFGLDGKSIEFMIDD